MATIPNSTTAFHRRITAESSPKVLRATLQVQESRRKILTTILTTSLALGLQSTPLALAQNWGTRSFIKERFFEPGLSPEDAVARIRQTAEGLHFLRPMLESMSWRYVIFYIRLKQAYLSQDMKTAMEMVPQARRNSYVEIANDLVDNMSEKIARISSIQLRNSPVNKGAYKMTEINDEVTVDEINHHSTAPKVEEDENSSHGDSKDVDMSSQNQMPSQKHEEEVIKKKYGGLLPKKPPLISKDHERAFFDSADWALGKVGAQKSKGPLEALRPKLEPSPHHHTRSRSAYASAGAGEGEDGCNSDDLNPGLDQDHPLDSNNIEIHSHSPEIQNLQN